METTQILDGDDIAFDETPAPAKNRKDKDEAATDQPSRSRTRRSRTRSESGGGRGPDRRTSRKHMAAAASKLLQLQAAGEQPCLDLAERLDVTPGDMVALTIAVLENGDRLAAPVRDIERIQKITDPMEALVEALAITEDVTRFRLAWDMLGDRVPATRPASTPLAAKDFASACMKLTDDDVARFVASLDLVS